jgi:hypothetical protein
MGERLTEVAHPEYWKRRPLAQMEEMKQVWAVRRGVLGGDARTGCSPP